MTRGRSATASVTPSLEKDVSKTGGSPLLPCLVPPPGWFHEQADDRARQDKLNIRTEASGAMPAAPAMKELAAARTQPREDVLKIGCGGRGRAQRDWVERSTREREQRKSEQAASNFETTVDDVLVGHAITGEMEWRTQCQSGKPRASERAHRSTRRNMERHDHDCPVGGPARTLLASLNRAPARRPQTASLLNRGRFPNAHQNGAPVRPRRYASDAAYLPREVFFGRFPFAGAFFSVWASDFGRFFPATSGSFRLIGCRDRLTLPPHRTARS